MKNKIALQIFVFAISIAWKAYSEPKFKYDERIHGPKKNEETQPSTPPNSHSTSTNPTYPPLPPTNESNPNSTDKASWQIPPPAANQQQDSASESQIPQLNPDQAQELKKRIQNMIQEMRQIPESANKSPEIPH